MTKIKDALLLFNPWWKGGWRLKYKERETYTLIKRFLEQPQMLAFTGLRRVGKTTLMLKIAEDRIRKGFDPRRVVYFSFDEFPEIELGLLLAEYSELMELDMQEGRYLLILDEIQKLKNWENQVKTLYDHLGKSAKIIVSGSESLFIRKKSKETLAGRIFEFRIDPLSFSEFLGFKGEEWKPIGLHARKLRRLFREFARSQGFPELVGVDDGIIITKYIQEAIIEKVIFRDLQLLVPIKDASVLHSLLNIFLEEPGQLTEVSKLAQEMRVSRQSISTYLQYLEDAFLLRKLYNYSRSRRKVERKLKKVYPTILSPYLVSRDDPLSQSKVFEWLVVNQLKAEFFWRDPYKNEVDVVLGKVEPVPVEIKFGKITTDGVESFMRKFKVNEGYILSKDTKKTLQREGKAIHVIPADEYLLREVKTKWK